MKNYFFLLGNNKKQKKKKKKLEKITIHKQLEDFEQMEQSLEKKNESMPFDSLVIRTKWITEDSTGQYIIVCLL